MIENWWKILTAVLLLYVLIAGMLVPLKPGYEAVTPNAIRAGEHLEMTVTGYNTQLTSARGTLRAWLKLTNAFAIPAANVNIVGDRVMTLHFDIPESFPLQGERQTLTLVTDDPVHGPIAVPGALFVRECVFQAGDPLWTAAPIAELNDVSDFRFPFRSILYETIRNTYYHVPMWFGMILLFFGSAYWSIRYMRRNDAKSDLYAVSLNLTGVVFGILGILTGMFWSTYTWGEPWSWDVKQNTAAITLLIYLAYFILRGSFEDPEQKARISSVYNVFACAMIIPLLFVIPRMTDSLHPGSGGNPAMGGEDLDNTMRMIFYPAVIAWTLLGVWISQVLYRIRVIRERWDY